MHERLLALFASRYPDLRAQFPDLGRRKLQLKVIQELWDALSRDPNAINALPTSQQLDPDDLMQDPDLSDTILDGPEQGLLVRTDFSNEEAWQSFCEKVAVAEKELVEAIKSDESSPTEGEASGSTSMDTDEPERPKDDEDEDDSSEDEGETPGPMIKIVDPPAESRSLLEGITNLTSLRLFNTVDIRPAPGPPQGEKRYQPQNRLVDQGGWQETYTGKNLWIYDAKSNADQCVRLVSQEGDIYGTATGDSWRVQCTHICELQFNMAFLGMKINFGGLDRWDFGERKRNLDESNLSV